MNTVKQRTSSNFARASLFALGLASLVTAGGCGDSVDDQPVAVDPVPRTSEAPSDAEETGAHAAAEPEDAGDGDPATPSHSAASPGPDRTAAQRLREAALAGQLDRVRQGLEQGVDVNAAGQDGRTALQLAAFDGHSRIIELLLERGAKVDVVDVSGRTALMYAATGDNVESVQLLLQAGADPNRIDSQEHFTPLMFAAAEGQLEVVRVLLDHGAQRSLEDVDGETALEFAEQNGHAEVVELLSVSEVPSDTGRTEKAGETAEASDTGESNSPRDLESP